MNSLIAKSITECNAWTGTAVVLDVLEDSTLLCALMHHGVREIRVFSSSQALEQAAAQLPRAQRFSGTEIGRAAHANPNHPALVLLREESARAADALHQAGTVLWGGFSNFQALAEALKAQTKEVLLVPASLFGSQEDVEDELCAQALKDYLEGIGQPAEAIENFYTTLRPAEYKKNSPKTAPENLQAAFGLNGFPSVVQTVALAPGSWLCRLYDPHNNAAQPGTDPDTLFKTQLNMELKDMNTLAQDARDAASSVELAALGPARQPPLAPAKEPEKAKNKEGIFSKILHKKEQDLEASLQADLTLSPQEPAPANPVLPSLTDEEVRQAVQQTPARPQASVPQASAVTPGSRKAIVLFSGGLDSTTCLYWALAQGYTCEALTVLYGQRHGREVDFARQTARRLGVKHYVIDLHLPWLQDCSLVNPAQPLPDIAVEQITSGRIPSTYVPARNLLFLAAAGSLLDAVGAQAVIAGPNAVDFSGYPDCTPAFFKAAAEALNRGTKQGVTEGIEVLAPLMRLSKAQIVKLAAELQVPFEQTWSCYAGGDKPCGRCDSCKLRAKGFQEAGVHDTALD